MDTMEIKVLIKETEKSTDIKVLAEGKVSSKGLIHAVSHYLLAIRECTNLAIVTDGIEEFCEKLGKGDE